MIRYLHTGPAGDVSATPAGEVRKQSAHLNLTMLEYSMIANLVSQQYQRGNDIYFEGLLSIPLTERIPGLIESYGKKTMHKLLVMLLQEFSNSLEVTKAKKVTDFRLRIAACELMLIAGEDFLSLEEVILFLQRTKAGHYGLIKNFSNPSVLFQKLDMYRQQRHAAYIKMAAEKEAYYKQLGTTVRTSPEPTSLTDLFHQAFVIDISNRA